MRDEYAVLAEFPLTDCICEKLLIIATEYFVTYVPRIHKWIPSIRIRIPSVPAALPLGLPPSMSNDQKAVIAHKQEGRYSFRLVKQEPLT